MTRHDRQSILHAAALNRRAISLVEMIVVVAVIAIAASMVLPKLTDDARLRVLAAAELMSSDIEFAQSNTLTDPQNPLVVRFDPATATYWIAAADDPETPLVRPDTGEPYLVQLGSDRAGLAEGVTFTIADIPAGTLGFDSYGAVSGGGADPVIRLTCKGESIDIVIAATTGVIRHVEVTS